MMKQVIGFGNENSTSEAFKDYELKYYALMSQKMKITHVEAMGYGLAIVSVLGFEEMRKSQNKKQEDALTL